jgi:two-component system response regulator HydG
MSAENHTSEVVYVLDDDPSVLKAIGRLLASEGVPYRTFDDPDSFLDSIKTDPSPVVILDVWMNGITGLELQAKLQNVSPHTRVIIMTGRSDSGVRQTAMKKGASAFLLKPFGDLELLNAVRAAFAASQ